MTIIDAAAPDLDLAWSRPLAERLLDHGFRLVGKDIVIVRRETPDCECKGLPRRHLNQGERPCTARASVDAAYA